MYELTGLRTLHNDMRLKGEDRATFPFEYNGKNFSCILLTDINPYRLYLTTLGCHPIVFEFEVERGYKVKCFIEDYKKLVDYLDLQFDPNHKFMPSDFFDVLNRNIPLEFKEKPDYKSVLTVVSKRREIEDELKIYFCGWRRNAAGERVSEKNLEKTRSAFGDEKADVSRKKNISSRWTDREDEEELKKLNELVKM